MNDLSPDTLFERLLDRFDRAYEEFLAAQGRPSLAGWLARAALLGELVAIEDAGRQYSGAFLGVDDDGALLLQEPDATIRKVVAGDVTRGPRAVPQLG